MKKYNLHNLEYLAITLVYYATSILLLFFPIQKIFLDTITILGSNPNYFSNSYDSTRFLFTPIIDALEVIGFSSQEYSSFSGPSFLILNYISYLIYSLVWMSSWYFLKIYKSNYKVRVQIYLLIILFLPFSVALNKETVTLLLGCTICCLLIKKRPNLIFGFILTLIYSLGGRYYFIVAYVLFIVLYKITSGYKSVIFVSVVALVVGYEVYTNKILYGLLTAARPDLSGISDSYISLPFKDENYLLFISNRAFLFLYNLFPILKMNKIYYLIYTLFFSILTIKLVNGLRNFRKYKVDVRAPILFVFSFYLSQSLFEPDMGSLIRHRMYLLPFYLVIIVAIDNKYVRQNEGI